MGRDVGAGAAPDADGAERLTLADGRFLEILVDGPAAGTLLGFHHGVCRR